MKLAIDPINQQATLKHHGKSFHLAGLLLGKAEFERAAALYAFLRTIDDQIDEAADDYTAERRLNTLRFACQHDRLTAEHDASHQLIINDRSISEFLRGMSYDTGHVAIQTVAQLEDYCYCVAGTVGEMMCDALHCTDKRARSHAIDLGVAMQMTNIARDVYEDASMNRRYLPASWVGDMTAEDILTAENADEQRIRAAICRLINRAEARYNTARDGIVLLPSRSRFGILAASYLYQGIGHAIVAEQASNWRQRKSLGVTAKLGCLLNCATDFALRPRYRRYQERSGQGKPRKSLQLTTSG